MLNLYTPFPRYENIIIVGDTAAEALAHLRIWGRALVGGDIPGMEMLHPAEKMLECTQCALRDRKKILDAAARRMQADYILLEENGVSGLDPAVMKPVLEQEGFAVKVLDVRGSPEEVMRRAGGLMNESRHAERIISDARTRMTALAAAPALPGLTVLAVVGIRHPIQNAVYGFAASKHSEMSREVVEFLGLRNIAECPDAEERLPGVLDLDNARVREMLAGSRPDVIALCGDSAAAAVAVEPLLRSWRSRPLMLPLPWHCRPMMWRRPRTLEIWHGALSAFCGRDLHENEASK